MQSEIAQAVDALIKSGSLTEPLNLSVPEMNVLDIYPNMRHLFAPEAIAVLDNKINQLIHQYNVYSGVPCMINFFKVQLLLNKLDIWHHINMDKLGWDRKFDAVHYFGSTCKEYNLEKAVENVITAVNTVTKLGYSKGALMPLGILRLQDGTLIVLSYITLTTAGEQYVDANMPKMTIKEGGIPPAAEEQQ